MERDENQSRGLLAIVGVVAMFVGIYYTSYFGLYDVLPREPVRLMYAITANSTAITIVVIISNGRAFKRLWHILIAALAK